MNSFGSPYRVEFSGGPQDGCFLETEVPLGKKVAVPNQPWGQIIGSPNAVCRSTGKPAATVRIRQSDNVAEYWLDRAEYRVENELPQVVFHYRFHPECDTERSPHRRSTGRAWKLRFRYWTSLQAARLSRWLQTPVDYPLDVRRIGG